MTDIKTNKERLLEYINEGWLTEEQCRVIINLIEDAHSTTWPNNDRFEELGFKSGQWDSAKPQPYIDRLHKEEGLDYDMLAFSCVFDYTNKSFGELVNWKQRYYEFLVKTFNK